MRTAYLDARFGEVELPGKHLSYEDIWIMAAKKCLFQFFHLPHGKVGACSTSLVVADAAVGVATVAVFVVVT